MEYSNESLEIPTHIRELLIALTSSESKDFDRKWRGMVGERVLQLLLSEFDVNLEGSLESYEEYKQDVGNGPDLYTDNVDGEVKTLTTTRLSGESNWNTLFESRFLHPDNFKFIWVWGGVVEDNIRDIATRHGVRIIIHIKREWIINGEWYRIISALKRLSNKIKKLHTDFHTRLVERVQASKTKNSTDSKIHSTLGNPLYSIMLSSIYARSKGDTILDWSKDNNGEYNRGKGPPIQR